MRARQRRSRLICGGKQAAERIRQDMLTQARSEQEALVERTRADIAREREAMLDSLRREAVDLSLAAAAKLIQQRLDATRTGDRARLSGALSATPPCAEEHPCATLRLPTVTRARVYDLASRHNPADEFAHAFEQVLALLAEQPRIQLFLQTPRLRVRRRRRRSPRFRWARSPLFLNSCSSHR